MSSESPIKPLTVLCVSIGMPGHINCVLGLAHILKERGHRVVFALDNSWKGKFEASGFEEEVYDENPPEPVEKKKLDDENKTGQQWIQMMQDKCKVFELSPLERLSIDEKSHWYRFVDSVIYSDSQIEKIINKVKPDVILVDHLVWHPCLVTCGLPMVGLMSANPIFALEDENTPPARSGLPLNGDRNEWEIFRKTQAEAENEVWTYYKDFAVSKGAPPPSKGKFTYISSNLNIYMYPKSLAQAYHEISSKAKHWINVDHCLRPETGPEFTLPEQFLNQPGKLIFLSMGSLGSSLVPLMKRLVNMLSKCEHKFIVVTGQMHDKYELAKDNMWGQPFLPQIAILPKVDLVIHHGGNNTFIEALYFGKPMIVMPLFADQFDNAQRAVEGGIGARFNPFKDPAEKLLELIDFVLNNEEMKANIDKVSKEIRQSQSLVVAAEKIEKVALSPISPNVIEAMST